VAKKKLQPGELYWELVDPVWDSINIYDGPRVFLRQYRQVNPEVGHLFAAHWCQSEVRNGGLHQFFSNSTGVLAPEALQGFRAIELWKWAAILEKAMGFFGEPYPRARTVRQKRLPRAQGRKREKWDPFDKLDDRFYKCTDGKDDRWELAADDYARKIVS
jgi:hypothetical protein